MRRVLVGIALCSYVSGEAAGQSCIQNRPAALGITSVWVASEICSGFPKLDNLGLRQVMKDKRAVDLSRSDEPDCARAMLELFTLPHVVHGKNPVMFCTTARQALEDPAIARHILNR